MRKLMVLLVMFLSTAPAFSMRQLEVIAPQLVVLPVRGSLIMFHDGSQSRLTGSTQTTLESGDTIYLPKTSQAIIQFVDGSQQKISGETQLTVVSFFYHKAASPVQYFKSVKNALSHMAGFFFRIIHAGTSSAR